MVSKVYIRADGSTTIGLGHLIRCMALGHMIKGYFEVNFVCKEIPNSIKRDMIQEGFYFRAIDREEEFIQSLNGSEIVVLDHYGLDSNYQKRIKEKGNSVVCIDDLHDKDFFADLIINHSPGVVPQEYTTPAYTQFALGTEYVLLRPPFLSPAEEKIKKKSKESVFICFGGADFKNLTLQTLITILDYEEIKKIVVVIGAAYRHQEELRLLGSKSKKVVIYDNVNAAKMAELISASDIAIVSSSGVLLEALAVGHHIVSGMYVKNQKLLHDYYKQVNAIYSAEDFSPDNLKRAINDCLSTKQYKKRVIDGHSGKRILKIFRQLEVEKKIELRSAEVSDLSLTYKWATNKAVRAFSFNQDEIKPEDHNKWFLSKIQDHKCLYLLAEWDGKEIGSFRIDIEGEEAIISYLIDPDYHNRGLGVPILKKGLEYVVLERNDEVNKIVGFVMPENIASCKVFERFGFIKTSERGNYKYMLMIN